jgi:hypothetical protein
LEGLLKKTVHRRMATRSKTREKWTRKNIVIDQYKLDRAKTVLRAPTETAAVDQALDLVAFQGEVLAGIDRLVEVGGIDDSFEKR